MQRKTTLGLMQCFLTIQEIIHCATIVRSCQRLLCAKTGGRNYSTEGVSLLCTCALLRMKDNFIEEMRSYLESDLSLDDRRRLRSRDCERLLDRDLSKIKEKG